MATSWLRTMAISLLVMSEMNVCEVMFIMDVHVDNMESGEFCITYLFKEKISGLRWESNPHLHNSKLSYQALGSKIVRSEVFKCSWYPVNDCRPAHQRFCGSTGRALHRRCWFNSHPSPTKENKISRLFDEALGIDTLYNVVRLKAIGDSTPSQGCLYLRVDNSIILLSSNSIKDSRH